MVGRAELLDCVESRIAAGASVVLTGPSGIGKTALLDAVRAAAGERGERVLRLAGAETERWISFAGLADLLGQIPRDYLAELPDPQRATVDGVLMRDPPADPGRNTEFACRLALQALLRRCAASERVLVLIDDAQWLDASSADVLTQAARRLPDSAVRVLAAGRWPDEASGGATVSTWLAVPAAVAVAVPPLAAADLVELLDQYGLPARVASKLHADSGGNPYLALALGGACTDTAALTGKPIPLPRHLHVLISERVRALPERVRETLLAAALADRPTIELLLRAGRADAEQDVRHAATTGLVAIDNGNIQFIPPATSAVITESVCAANRAKVHRALSGVMTDVAGRARHCALASADASAEVARSLVLAADVARRRGARGLAAELYLLAADRTPSEMEDERLERLVAAAETGATAIRAEIVHRAAGMVIAADSSAAQRVRVRLALIDLRGQALSEADDVFAAALVDAGNAPELAAPIRLRMAWAALVDGEPGRSDREAGMAADLAHLSGDTSTEAMALAATAMAWRMVGRGDYPVPLDLALKLPQRTFDGWLHRAPCFLATRFAVFDDRLHEARADLLTMLALVERGAGEELVQVLRSLSEVSARLGRCREALDFTARAIRISEQAGLSPGPAWYDAAVAELAGGCLSHAVAYAERGIRASEQEKDSVYLGRHLHALGQARLRLGETRSGVDTLRRLQIMERANGVSAPLVIRWHSDLAAGHAILGEWAEAERVIGAAREAVEGDARGEGVMARLDRSEALLRAARGDVDFAMELLGSAAERFELLDEPLDRGQCLLVQAQVERRRRRHATARSAVQEALAIFNRCGARPWSMQAGRALAQFAGSPVDRPKPSGEDHDPVKVVAALTNAEERVALMVGEGASNQEVAARMFLSVKTIEASLTRIYRKLGVRSRTQLSSWLRSAYRP